METTGMTEGGPSDDSALEILGGSLENPEIKDEAESMEDERDPEVGSFTSGFVSMFNVEIRNL